MTGSTNKASVEAEQAGVGTNITMTQPGRATTGGNSRQAMVADSRGAKSECPSAGLNAHVTSLDLLIVGFVTCLAVTTNGTWLVCTATALYTVSPNGLLTLLAGHTSEAGFKDGQGSAARFDSPAAIVVDGAGTMLVADSVNHTLRKVTRTGAVSTLAGNGQKGYADGVGNAARFSFPKGIVVGVDGTIYVTDHGNNCVRQVRPDDGAVSTLAGDGKAGAGFADGLGLSARFDGPAGLALDTDDHLIVAEINNSCIRRVTTAEGRVTTVAVSVIGEGFADGKSATATFHAPMAIAVDGNNNILVADFFNNRIQMVAGAGAHVTTVAGGASGKVDGPGASARFDQPWAVALDEHGRLLVADNNHSCVRVIEASLAPPGQLLAAKVLLLQVCARSPHKQYCACCG